MILSPERRAALTAKAKGFTAHVGEAEAYLLSRGISLQVAEMFGLGYVQHGHEFGGRVSIPYVTPAGVVTIKYRCADLSHGDHKEVSCAKYLHETGLGTHLWNAQALIRADDKVVITEGEIDAMCVQAYCGIPAVAYPGAEAWGKQPHYRLCFEGVPEVIVVADGDKPGKAAAARVVESIGHTARMVPMPDGDDANSYIVKHGAQAFVDKLNR